MGSKIDDPEAYWLDPTNGAATDSGVSLPSAPVRAIVLDGTKTATTSSMQATAQQNPKTRLAAPFDITVSPCYTVSS